MVMRTSTGTLPDARPSACGQAELALAGDRLRAPASIANIARNARAEVGRHGRWAPARDALWRLLDPYVADGARVAILGAGNGDTLPLAPIAARAREVALIDLDDPAGAALSHRARRGRERGLGRTGHDRAGHHVFDGRPCARLAAELKLYDDHGHWLLEEPSYETIVADVGAWLERVVARDAAPLRATGS